LIATERGAGRDQVDEEGQLVRAKPEDKDGGQQDADLPPEDLTDEWLRYDGFPSGGKTNRPVSVHGESPANHVVQEVGDEYSEESDED
jgi:hypothetical protein